MARRATQRTLALAVALTAVAAWSSPLARAETTRTVGSCEQSATSWSTIQAAVDASAPGDSVVVCPGAYQESVIVRNPGLTIRSRDGAAATSVGPPPAGGYFGVSIQAPDVTVGCVGTPAKGCSEPGTTNFGFTIRPAGIPIDVANELPGSGIVSDRARVEGNAITGFIEVGISIGEGADGVTVRANTVTQTSPLPGTVAAQLHGIAGIAVNTRGAASSPATYNADISANTVVAPPGLAGRNDGTPSGAAMAAGIGVWNRGSGHLVAGNTVQNTGVGISVASEVSDSQLSGNVVGAPVPASGTDADGKAPPAENPARAGFTDSSANGVFAYDKRNLWYGNQCGAGYEASSPKELCGPSAAPPEPTRLIPDTIVEGIPADVEVHGAGGKLSSRIKIAGDPSDPSGYRPDASFDDEHAVELPVHGDYPVYAQAQSEDGAPISRPVELALSVSENELPTPSLGEQSGIEVEEDGAPGAITLSATGNEPEESVTLKVVDADSLALGHLEGVAPSGVVAQTGVVSYVPHPEKRGSESFRVVACDGFPRPAGAARPTNPEGCSDELEVPVTVSPVNDSPTASDASMSLDEDTAKVLQLTGWDRETANPAQLVYRLVGDSDGNGSVRTAKGTVELEPGSRRATYTPDPDENGTDGFQFTVDDSGDPPGAPSDPARSSDPAKVSITIRPVADAPTAESLEATTDEDASPVLTLSADDVDAEDSGRLEYAIAQAPKHGRLGAVGRDGSVIYTPPTDFNGADSFRYSVTDSHGLRDEAEVSLAIAPVEDAPIATPGELELTQGKPGSVTLRATDAEGDPIGFSISAQPAHGSVVLEGDRVTYTPSPNFSGADAFSFRASDSAGGSSEAKVAISVRRAPAERTAAAEPPPAAPPPPSPPPSTAAPPELVAQIVHGPVVVTPTGGKGQRLAPGDAVPAGSRVDATRGTVVIAINESGKPAQHLSASRGAFTLIRRAEGNGTVTELRLAAARAKLLTSTNCRCRVVTRDAAIDAFGRARWTTVRDRGGTLVRHGSGRLRVVDQRRCRSWSLPRRRASSRSASAGAQVRVARPRARGC